MYVYVKSGACQGFCLFLLYSEHVKLSTFQPSIFLSLYPTGDNSIDMMMSTDPVAHGSGLVLILYGHPEHVVQV